MSPESVQFDALRALHQQCHLIKEGGVAMALLEGLPFRAADRDWKMDLLLYPAQHSGYTSRLFFQEQIAGRGANWNRFRLAERDWWSPSWQSVPASLPWPKMLAAHLRGVA
ncbi:MAG: hypothetical protein JNN24_14395 [Hyphomicrobium zavarzinii]|uniref:hypothetical protein n=1 Tax=Hyphomicrobium zavarzinii TaxID=48292 RepID=UPI001A48E064|nr:hypothetical protein [Hyphomicrobium zavarzinii]MBL8846953.1 hypothetical protein [Hyphomicrobium zavarzinii]